MRFVAWLVTNALSLAAATALLGGISIAGPTSGQAELQEKLVPLLVVAVILGLLTSFVKPVLRFLSFPVIVLSLGLFLLVINAGLLLLADRIAGGFDVDFRVDDFFPSAVAGSIIITVVTWLIDSVIDPEDRRGR